MKRGLILIIGFVVSFLLSGCGPGQVFGPTITPSPTATIIPSSTPTFVPTATLTLTPTPTEVPTLTPTLDIKTFTFSVPANEPWVNTGIILSDGQTLIITASGKINTNGGRANGSTLSPDGQANNPFCSPYKSAKCLMADLYWGTLIGKIGEGSPFKVGSQMQIQVSGSGNLYLAVNDNEGYFYDNSGAFETTIVVIR